MKPIKSHTFKRLLYASALFALAIAPSKLFAAAPYNSNTTTHPDDDLSVRPTGTVTYLVNTNTDPRLYGKVGPLLVMHAMSVHNTIVWKTNEDTPKMLMFQRHSGYRADEITNPDIINFLISTPNPGPGALLNQTALGNSGNQFNSAFRRAFQQLCYGGYNIIHDVSQSVAQRIRVDQNIETCQLYDWGHPDAYKYDFLNPKYSPGALNNHDAELNFAATKNMGPSRGLYYDMYCPGFCTLEDGRPIFPGGHDMNSQNGNYRIQVFDPDAETWLARPASCMRLQYNADPNDPYSEGFFQSQINLGKGETNIYFLTGNSLAGDCNPHNIGNVPGVNYSTNYPAIRLMGPNGTVTHPNPVPGDMKYARWYPGTIALPGNRAFIFGGWDRDEKTPPIRGAISSQTTAHSNFLFGATAANYNLPDKWKLSGFLSSDGSDVPANQVTQPVPEIYDGNTDTTYPLENARLVQPAWYPNSTIVQTGPNEDDWQVLVNSSQLFEDSAEAGGELGSASSETVARHTFLVDIQGAMNDPDRLIPNVREGKWIKYVDTATNTFAPFSANADIEELDAQGQTVTHRLYHFGGRNSVGTAVASCMYLELAPLSKARLPGAAPVAMPRWTTTPGSLVARARQNYAAALPNGKIVIFGGNGTGNAGMEAWSLHVQMFDPATGSIQRMDKTGVPRDEHGIIHLWPDGRVFMGGQNRNGISVAGDPFAPAGDPDLGVTCGQFYTPPYLFDSNTNDAVRPVITSAPKQIDYGVDFNVTVDDASQISSVCLIRTGSMSHSLHTDFRYIKVPFTSVGGNVLRVTAPVLPGTAIGGYYELFVVNKNETPAMAKKIVLGTYVASRH
ncbi:MAG: hypothetical protein JWN25_2655 [Verrucomicrobiales bacterium]|nr:hypothetical protein [Verrucomicrobiales bacterium]